MITAKFILAYLLQFASVLGIHADTCNIDAQEAFCLAQNIFYEAKSEDSNGQLAVAAVTINRTHDKRYPQTICGVVKQAVYSTITNRPVCAFSWYCDNKLKDDILFSKKDGSIDELKEEQFRAASMIAINMLAGEAEDITHGATHFFNPSVSNPPWKIKMTKTLTLGNHVFYR